MKLVTLAILLFACASIECKNEKSNLKSTLSNKEKQFPGMPVSDSIRYGYATNDNYPLQHAENFKTPIYMEKIPIHLNHPYTGVMGEAQTVNNWIKLACNW